MKIAEASTFELEVVDGGHLVFINQGVRWVKVHIDDIPELIKELERISKSEG